MNSLYLPRYLARAALLVMIASVLTACEPQLDSSDPDERLRAIDEGSPTQDTLSDIAWDDDVDSVRAAAVKRMTNQNVLANLLLRDRAAGSKTPETTAFRKSVFARLTDQEFLAKVALESRVDDIRRAASAKLTDQNLLAEIAIQMTFDAYPQAVGKITSQKILATIAQDAKSPLIQETALNKISDQTILVELATTLQRPQSRGKAVFKLTDPAALAHIATKGQDPPIQLIAVSKLADPTLLSRIALESTDVDVRKAAARKITDQTVLSQLATGDDHRSVRKAAMERLIDQGIIAKIILEDKDPGVREAAIKKLNAPLLLVKVAAATGHSWVHSAVLKKLPEKSTLVALTAETNDEKFRTVLKVVLISLDAVQTQQESDNSLALFHTTSIVRALFNPALAAVTGEITHIEAEAETLSAGYAPDWSYDHRDFGYLARKDVSGTKITIKVTLKNLPGMYSHSWNTIFPKKLAPDTRRLGVDVRVEDLVGKLLSKFSQEMLETLAGNNNDPIIRAAAVDNLEDIELLHRLTMAKSDWRVRVAAARNLIARKDPIDITKDDNVEMGWIAALRDFSDRDLFILAMGTLNNDVRRAAVKQQQDNSLLEMLAEVDQSSWARNIYETSSSRLSFLKAEIRTATQSKDVFARSRAVLFVKDQDVLAGIAVNDASAFVRIKAIEAISDSHLGVLATIAFADTDRSARKAALSRLVSQGSLREAVFEAQDRKERRALTAIAFALEVCSAIPKAHRHRWIMNIADVVFALSNPLLTPDRATPTALEVDWSETSQTYTGDKIVRGEYVSVILKTHDNPAGYSASWSTVFPDGSLGSHFEPADFETQDLFENILAGLDQDSVAKLVGNERHPGLRGGAIRHLTEQSLLAQIAIQDVDWTNRRTAVKSLNDPKLLAKVVAESTDQTIQHDAKWRLKNLQ